MAAQIKPGPRRAHQFRSAALAGIWGEVDRFEGAAAPAAVA
jgi:hypothetical protein